MPTKHRQNHIKRNFGLIILILGLGLFLVYHTRKEEPPADLLRGRRFVESDLVQGRLWGQSPTAVSHRLKVSLQSSGKSEFPKWVFSPDFYKLWGVHQDDKKRAAWKIPQPPKEKDIDITPVRAQNKPSNAAGPQKDAGMFLFNPEAVPPGFEIFESRPQEWLTFFKGELFSCWIKVPLDDWDDYEDPARDHFGMPKKNHFLLRLPRNISATPILLHVYRWEGNPSNFFIVKVEHVSVKFDPKKHGPLWSGTAAQKTMAVHKESVPDLYIVASRAQKESP